MSGNTGSLRYMAPEVARMDSYNEKVDVHSFGILLWQVASRDLPFKGFTREDYMKFVVEFGLRPDVPSSWPKSVKKLLSQCWDPGAELRPSFEVVVARFKKIMEELVPL